MKFKYVQDCIQLGYRFDDDIDPNDIKWSPVIVKSILEDHEDHEEYEVFQKMSDEELTLVLEDLLDYEDKESFGLMAKTTIGKEKIIELLIQMDEVVSDIYMKIEDVWYVGSELSEISNEDLKLYCKYMKPDDPYYEEFMKTLDFFGWCVGSFKTNGEVSGDDMVMFLDNYMYVDDFTEEICLTDGFQDSFNSYPKSSFSNNKVNVAYELVERFGDTVKQRLIDTSYGIEEETFMTEEEIDQQKKKDQEKSLSDLITGVKHRVTKRECDLYLNANTFSKDISVVEGSIGLEDMAFSYIIIDGKLIGEQFCGNAWISGRSFGDYQLSGKFFLETVNEYLK